MNKIVETEIGTIGSNWNVVPLEEVCEPPQYGYTASAGEQGNARLLRITDIEESGVNWSTVPFCACPPELLDKYRLATGDIVFARIGATTGKSYLITNPPLSVFASYLIRVRTKSALEPVFLSQFFRSRGYWRQVNAAKNANLKKGVSGSLLKVLLVPVPPLPEQRKIAGVLGLILRAIDQQERLLALTAELKNVLLRQLFTQGLRGEPQKETEIGPVPKSWDVVPLGDVIAEDPKNGLYKHSSAYGTGTPILRINDFSNDGDIVTSASNRVTTDASERKIYALRKDDLVVNRVNSLSHLGKTALIGELPEAMVFESNMMRFRVDEHRALPQYVLRLLNSPICKKQVIGSAKRAVAQSSINQGNVKAILLPLPSVAIQGEITSILETTVKKIQLHEMMRHSLGDLFRTLLHQLMTAKIRVHDLDIPELEAAAAQ